MSCFSYLACMDEKFLRESCLDWLLTELKDQATVAGLFGRNRKLRAFLIQDPNRFELFRVGMPRPEDQEYLTKIQDFLYQFAVKSGYLAVHWRWITADQFVFPVEQMRIVEVEADYFLSFATASEPETTYRYVSKDFRGR